MSNIEQNNQQNQIIISLKYELKAMILLLQKKFEVDKNKTISSIKNNYLEIEKCLKTNNLDVAKLKMDNIINKENKISALDILIFNCDILKENINVLIQNNKVPNELRKSLDSLMYSSTRLKIEEFNKLRAMIQNKFGLDYIKSCDNNNDNFVDQNLIEKLGIKQNDNSLIIIKLKTYCNYKKINFNFDDNFHNLKMNINNNMNNNNNKNNNNNNYSDVDNDNKFNHINNINNNQNSNLDCEYFGGNGFNPFINNIISNNDNRIEINYPQQPKIDDDIIINNKSNESGFNLLDSCSTNNNSSQLSKGSNSSFPNQSQINKSNFKSNSFNIINDSKFS